MLDRSSASEVGHTMYRIRYSVWQRWAVSYLLALSLVPIATDRLAFAKLSFARPFGDHMVVQRDMELPIWGKADGQQPIEVRIGNENRTTVADEDGRWRVVFPARKASNRPLTIEVRSGEETLTLSDVLVGEVWLCAGQSNMEWAVSLSASAKETQATANNPHIRLLNYRGAARGGSGQYSPEHLKRMTPEKFCQGRWHVSSWESVKPFSAVGFYFGAMIERELDVPIGLINVSIGGTPAEAWVRREAMAAHPRLKSLVNGNWLKNELLGEWCRTRATTNLRRATQAGESIPGDDLGPNHSFKPCFMWDSAVAPLIPFPIRGVLWYQGESNAQQGWRVRQHRAIFESLVKDWRAQFGLGDFPFLYVQLPGMGRPNWPEFREQQRRFLDTLPNVGMAVTMDVGHPTDVHPKTKKPVGERLARWALATTYGQKDTVASGPLYRSMRIEGGKIVLEFDHVGSGLQTRDGLPLRHFEIASEDGAFQPAEACIENDTVVVTSELVARPEYVRYCWTAFPKPPVNFFNRDDLPASPFSTLTENQEH